MVEQDGQSNVKKKEDGKNKKKKIVLIICIIIIIVLLGVIIYLLAAKNTTKKPRRNVVVTEKNIDKVLKEMNEKRTPAGSYEAKMNSVWNFERGDAPSKDAYVENVKTNTNPVYFDVVRSDTEETIYESPILPVGSHLEEITLDKKLPAGKYDCVLTYHLIDEEEETISTVRLTLTINIEK